MAAFSVSNNTIHHKRQKSPLYAAYRFLYSGLVARFGSHPGTGSQRARFFCGCLSVSHSPLQSMEKTNTAIIDAVSVLYTHKSISLSLLILITYSYYLLFEFWLFLAWFLVVFLYFQAKTKGGRIATLAMMKTLTQKQGYFFLLFWGKSMNWQRPAGTPISFARFSFRFTLVTVIFYTSFLHILLLKCCLNPQTSGAKYQVL